MGRMDCFLKMYILNVEAEVVVYQYSEIILQNKKNYFIK